MTDRFIATTGPGAAAAGAFVLFFAFPLPALAQGGGGVGGYAAAPLARAARVETAPTVDARLDEPVWSRAEPVTAFRQVEPDEGAPASQPTEVRILFDDEALYVGAVLRDSEPVSSRLARRDAYMPDSDWFSVTLDTYHDHRTAYRFMVNPAGVRNDEALSGNDWRGDDSWDPVWEVETAVGDSGWTVEMRIPFSQLRFSEGPGRLWGLQLEREIARRQEEAVFAFTPRSERGGIARYGHLAGIEGVRPGRGLEFLPYAVARGEYLEVDRDPDVPFASPYRDGADHYASVGLDVKYRVASNLTLDATFNPDFGQVEVDPAVVNLTAYETRFDEKRPFFVEGASIFRFGNGGGFGGGTQLLYSRRIGDAPRWSAPDEAAYHDVPNAATILGAAKLTGRTAGAWSIGVLDAVTAEEAALYVTAEGLERSQVASPLSNYFVARLERGLRDGQTVVGALATAVNRRVGGLELADRIRGSAYSGGLDFRHEWADRVWVLSGYFAASRIAGDPEAIARAQRSSARYFHRPDAGHLRYDPTRTSLAGYSANLELAKEAGLHWRGSVEASATSPGFEVNDLGFQRDADRLGLAASVHYVENRPGRTFRDWRIQARPGARWNFGGDFLGANLSFEAGGELLSYWSGEVRLSRDLPGLDDRLTRGGPLTGEPAGTRTSIRVSSDARKPWRVSANVGYDVDDAGGREFEVGFDLDLRPADSWSVSLGPEVSRERSAAQYVGSVEDPFAAATLGRRYLFSSLEQTTVSLDTRLNVTFRPGLTVELYAQPFLASAAFDGLGELRAPRTFDFLRYGRDVGTITREDDRFLVDPDGDGPAAAFQVEDEDFNRRSLRGNAVLRWEWRPGSTVYLVWQQGVPPATVSATSTSTVTPAPCSGRAPRTSCSSRSTTG